jgi:Holliday junction resolvase
MRKRRKIMSEQDIQTAIREKLEKKGWFVVKIMVCSKPGFPDLLCLRNAKTVLIEVKDKGKIPDPSKTLREGEALQLYRHTKLRSMGFEVILTDNTDSIKHLL